MLRFRLGTVNIFHWGLSKFKAIANFTFSQHCLEKKTKTNYIFYSTHATQTDRKVEGTMSEKKGGKENSMYISLLPRKVITVPLQKGLV